MVAIHSTGEEISPRSAANATSAWSDPDPGSGFRYPLNSSMATIEPSPRTSPMQLNLRHLPQPALYALLKCQVRSYILPARTLSSTASAAAQPSGLPASAAVPGADIVHDTARLTTADMGKPPAILLARVVRSGTTPLCSMANIFRPTGTRLYFICNQQNAVLVAQRAQTLQKFEWSGRSPSPCTGSMMIAAPVPARHPPLKMFLQGGQRLLNPDAVKCNRKVGGVEYLRRKGPKPTL